jgi:hypothetical protein
MKTQKPIYKVYTHKPRITMARFKASATMQLRPSRVGSGLPTSYARLAISRKIEDLEYIYLFDIIPVVKAGNVIKSLDFRRVIQSTGPAFHTTFYGFPSRNEM